MIGGGHNGLTCAAYLARAGRKVLVLERRHVQVGGAAVSEEIYTPASQFSVCSYVVSLLRPHIIRELEAGTSTASRSCPSTATFTAAPDGRSLASLDGDGRADPQGDREVLPRKDAETYTEFGAWR